MAADLAAQSTPRTIDWTIGNDALSFHLLPRPGIHRHRLSPRQGDIAHYSRDQLPAVGRVGASAAALS